MRHPPTNLPESRLRAIEYGARKENTLGSNVRLELVAEIRMLREIVAAAPEPFES